MQVQSVIKNTILELWNHFDKIELSCSIDSWGERAEVMRHGTDWGRVEANLKQFRNYDKVDFQLNTVFRNNELHDTNRVL